MNNTNGFRPNGQISHDGPPPRAMNAAEGSIVVNAPVSDIYDRWLVFEEYPKFITAIKSVKKLDENHFAALLTFNGKPHETVLEMMLRVPERRMAWRTIADHHAPDHFAAGVISFAALSGQRTCVTFKLATSFGGAVSRRVDKYLHNFKRMVERA